MSAFGPNAGDRNANQISYTLLEEAQVVAENLDSVCAMHPFVRPGVLALKAICKIEMLRRAREPKVASLVVQAANTLGAVLCLVNVGTLDASLGLRLQDIVGRVTADLQEAGAVIEKYYRAKLARHVRANQWDGTFQDFERRFVERKSELDICVTAIVARTADARFQVVADELSRQQRQSRAQDFEPSARGERYEASLRGEQDGASETYEIESTRTTVISNLPTARADTDYASAYNPDYSEMPTRAAASAPLNYASHYPLPAASAASPPSYGSTDDRSYSAVPTTSAASAAPNYASVPTRSSASVAPDYASVSTRSSPSAAPGYASSSPPDQYPQYATDGRAATVPPGRANNSMPVNTAPYRTEQPETRSSSSVPPMSSYPSHSGIASQHPHAIQVLPPTQPQLPASYYSVSPLPSQAQASQTSQQASDSGRYYRPIQPTSQASVPLASAPSTAHAPLSYALPDAASAPPAAGISAPASMTNTAPWSPSAPTAPPSMANTAPWSPSAPTEQWSPYTAAPSSSTSGQIWWSPYQEVGKSGSSSPAPPVDSPGKPKRSGWNVFGKLGFSSKAKKSDDPMEWPARPADVVDGAEQSNGAYPRKDADPAKADAEKRLHRVDQIESNINLAADGAAKANDACDDYNDTIHSALAALAKATRGDPLTKTSSELLDAAEKVVKGLDVIKHIHPFVSVSVTVFQKVVALELTRRKNDERVVMLIAQATEMMSTLFRLKDIREADVNGPDGLAMRGALQTVLEKVSIDITHCGNTVSKYYEMHIVVKIFKSGSWEETFQGLVKTFVERTDEITRALAIHTALRIDSLGNHISNVTEKINAIYEILSRRTDEEHVLEAHIEGLGGADAFRSNPAKLKVLAQMIANWQGDGDSGNGFMSVANTEADSETLVETLAHDMDTPLNELLAEHLSSFQQLLDGQTVQLLASIKEGTQAITKTIDVSKDHITGEVHVAKTVITSAVEVEGKRVEQAIVKRLDAVKNDGPHAAIQNPHVRQVWALNRWPMQVRARECIHALVKYCRDDAVDRRRDAPYQRYFTVAFVPVLIEAFDRDASALISAREMNALFEIMPLDWHIRQHLAYWAAGWHAETCWYRDAIDRVLDFPDEKLCLPEEIVEGVRMLSRSFNPAIHGQNDAHLLELVKEHRRHEESRLVQVLEATAFYVEENSVKLLFGAQRLESYLFPLIYLALRQFFAGTSEELRTAVRITLESILGEVDYRIAELAESFSQEGLKPDEHFKTFACGLYCERWIKSQSDLAKVTDLAPSSLTQTSDMVLHELAATMHQRMDQMEQRFDMRLTHIELALQQILRALQGGKGSLTL